MGRIRTEKGTLGSWAPGGKRPEVISLSLSKEGEELRPVAGLRRIGGKTESITRALHGALERLLVETPQRPRLGPEEVRDVPHGRVRTRTGEWVVRTEAVSERLRDEITPRRGGGTNRAASRVLDGETDGGLEQGHESRPPALFHRPDEALHPRLHLRRHGEVLLAFLVSSRHGHVLRVPQRDQHLLVAVECRPDGRRRARRQRRVGWHAEPDEPREGALHVAGPQSSFATIARSVESPLRPRAGISAELVEDAGRSALDRVGRGASQTRDARVVSHCMKQPGIRRRFTRRELVEERPQLQALIDRQAVKEAPPLVDVTLVVPRAISNRTLRRSRLRRPLPPAQGPTARRSASGCSRRDLMTSSYARRVYAPRTPCRARRASTG